MSLNVLIVDDSKTIRLMIKKALTMVVPDLGEVLEAGDGFAALAAIASFTDHSVDLILADINMPRMNGVELVKRLKAHSETSEVPIVMITSEGSRDRLEELTECGVAAYIRKPFRAEKLREVLQEIVEVGDDSNVEETSGIDF